MKPFSDEELEYLQSQHLGRLATVQPNGTVQNSPVGFRYNPDTGTIDISGINMAATRKYRNVEAGSRAAFVVDDIVSVDPWRVRGVEIRGRAEAVPEPRPIIRIHPDRVIAWGLDSALGGNDVLMALVTTVGSWDGVTTNPHRFGGTQFVVGRRELGHVHIGPPGRSFVDLPLPRKVRDELVAGGRAQPHHVLPDSGWVTVPVRTRADVERVIAIFRTSYERSSGAALKAG